MIADGLWTIVIAAATEENRGASVSEEINRGVVFVISGGTVLGGGISFYFTGTCVDEGDGISLRIRSVRYNDLVIGPFGVGNSAELEFRGHVTGESMSLEGDLVGKPEAKLTIYAQRRARVP